MYGLDQIHLQSIHLSGKHRNIRTLVSGLAYPIFPIIEITIYINTESERYRRLEHRYMIFECLVEVLQTAHGQYISVHIQHEREYLQPVVTDKSTHGHITHITLLLIPEHQQLGELPELRAVFQRHVTSAYLHDAAHGFGHEIHIGIQIRSRRHLAIQQTLE